MFVNSKPIPLLDLSTARNEDGSFNQKFIDELRDAAHRVGFFQLTGYGAAPGQVEDLFDVTERFFTLPLEDRVALSNLNSRHFRGYTRLGHEITGGRPDAREQLDLSPDREPVTDYPAGQPYGLLQGPNLWPDSSLPELKTTALAWTDMMSEVGAELLRGIAAALELPEN